MDKSTPQQTIEIPDTARTRCPLVEFRLRSLGHCMSCEHFRGLSDRFPNSKHAFAVRYAVLCAGEATKREIFELEV